MPVRSLRDAVITLYDGGGNSVVVDLEEGDLSWDEKYPINVIYDRGAISHARKANEEYFDLSFSMKYQTLSTHVAVTPYDILTKTGGAAAYTSVGEVNDTYAVRVAFVITDPDTGTAANETFDFVFYAENIEPGEGEEYGLIAVSGRAKFSAAHWIREWAYAWWRTDDTAYMWQELAMSTHPASLDDPVAVIVDRLGNSNLRAASDATAGLYKPTTYMGSRPTVAGDAVDKRLYSDGLVPDTNCIHLHTGFLTNGGATDRGWYWNNLATTWSSINGLMKQSSSWSFQMNQTGPGITTTQADHERTAGHFVKLNYNTDTITVAGGTGGEDTYVSNVVWGTDDIQFFYATGQAYDANALGEHVILKPSIPASILAIIEVDVKARWGF